MFRHQYDPIRRQRHGATALELVCVLPVLIGIVLGGADLGRFAHYDNVISNVARVGAEYGATHRRMSRNASTWEEKLIAAATEEAENLPDFDADNLDIAVETTDEADGRLRVSVTVTYPFETVVDWPGLPADFDLSSTIVYVEYR
jgi:Flp pilus assembly protein TadG